MSIDAALSSSLMKTVAFNDYTVSAVALLWHDWLLTLEEEVEFIWKQRWGLGKYLYVMNRFIPMIDLLILALSYSDITLNLSICTPWWYIDTWLSILNFLVMDVVLLLRTWALWNRDKRILVVLIVAIVISALSSGGASLYASLVVTTDIPSEDHIRPCGSSFPDVKPLYGIWAGLMLYDTVVMFLILFKAIPVFLSMPLTPTLKTFFQDGFMYYIIIFIAAFANILMISFAPGELATTLFTFHRSMSSLLGSRMILNLRGAIMRPSAFAAMDAYDDNYLPGDSAVMSGIVGLESYSRKQTYGHKVSASMTGARKGYGVRSNPRDEEEMEMTELRGWRADEALNIKEDDEMSTRSRPRSANDLTGAVKVQITTSVKWDGVDDAAGWRQGR